MAHMPLSAVVGCDAYIRENGEYIYAGTFVPPHYTGEIATRGGYESLIRLCERKMRDITINLPLFYPVSGISIGVDKDGIKFFKDFGGDDCCTVDRIHPNDLGFYGMATKFAEVIEKIGY